MPANVKGAVSLLTVGLLVAFMAGRAQAKPTWGGDCADCHGGSRDGMELTGQDGLGGPGNLKLFNVHPGETAQISFDVTDGHNKHAVAVTGLDDPGITTAATLAASVDMGSVWNDQGSYYATDIHSASTGLYTFSLDVDPAATPDLYELSATLAGKNGGKWHQTENFYVQVAAQEAPEPGTLAMLLAGSLGLAAVVLRRRQAA